MCKKTWIWVVFIALFPPLLIVPLVKYLIYLPLRDGVIGGSRTRFYVWGSFISGLTVLATIPIPLDKKNDFIKIYKYLSYPANSSKFIFVTFVLGVLSVFLYFYSTRNEPEQKQFLPVRKFSPDKLFFICLALAFMPLLSYFTIDSFSIDEIKHPFAYAIGVAFINKNFFAVMVGILSVTTLTAIIEESFFRGIILRDYFNVGKKGKYFLLFIAALYFAYCHWPIAFTSPFIFAIFINRIRLAYNNLVPGILLHAVWNANVIVLVLIFVNPNAPVHVHRSAKEELIMISQIWNQKELEFAKKIFPKYKFENKLHVFKGIHMTLLGGTSNSSELVSLFAIVKKHSQEDVEKIFYSDDWESKKKSRCSKKIDLCVQKDGDSVLLNFDYNFHTNKK